MISRIHCTYFAAAGLSRATSVKRRRTKIFSQKQSASDAGCPITQNGVSKKKAKMSVDSKSVAAGVDAAKSAIPKRGVQIGTLLSLTLVGLLALMWIVLAAS